MVSRIFAVLICRDLLSLPFVQYNMPVYVFVYVFKKRKPTIRFALSVRPVQSARPSEWIPRWRGHTSAV